MLPIMGCLSCTIIINIIVVHAVHVIITVCTPKLRISNIDYYCMMYMYLMHFAWCAMYIILLRMVILVSHVMVYI